MKRGGFRVLSFIIIVLVMLLISQISIGLSQDLTNTSLNIVGDRGLLRVPSEREVVRRERVVLITGDVVDAFILANGSMRLAIKPFNPTKLNRHFRVYEDSSGVYVIPSDVDLRKFDRSLFNIKLLIQQMNLTGRRDVLPVIVQGMTVKQTSNIVKVMREKRLPAKIIHPKLNLAKVRFDLRDRRRLRRLFETLPAFKKMWLDKAHKLSYSRGQSGFIRPMLDVSVPMVGAEWVWTHTQASGRGVKIAILDTGIDFTHRDFKFMNGTSKIIAAESFVDWPEEEIDDPTDYHGHGTHVSGIAAGTGLTQLNPDYLSPIAHPLIRREGNDEASIVAGNGTHLVVVWHSDVTGNWDIWAAIYDGEEWHGPIQLTDDLNVDRWPYVALLSNNRILVMWYSNRTGNVEIWYKVYINGEWTEDRQLTTHSEDYDYLPAFTELPDGKIAMIWTSEPVDSNTSDVWFANLSMADDGTLSFITEMKITNARPNQWLIARSIVLTGNRSLWAFYDDISNFNSETDWGGITTMYYNISSDGGQTWRGYELYSCSGCFGSIATELGNEH